ncbi:DUF2384 domain-containing protein [Belnapia sp. T18]|uniref:DUF2384 domain-containing protein n=1 Tax=Belnapia arida TaxID=2804533 RepID=A0ABS1UF79_9PROT|nr:antitoxin Xre/MbcA/ParS toxin-binding domain-containing protein [Belnapia arida]MBL6082357.1 DUF2384 domain-containing protein [Belnapia arida]
MPTLIPKDLSFLVTLNNGDIKLTEAPLEGLPVQVALEILQTGRLTATELNKLVRADLSSANSMVSGGLTSAQFARLFRVIKVLLKAEDTFANREKAYHWLRRPTSALAEIAPLDLLDTDFGSQQVESLLDHIGHGTAA